MKENIQHHKLINMKKSEKFWLVFWIIVLSTLHIISFEGCKFNIVDAFRK